MKTKLTADDMYTAATTLKKSERGRQAMGGLKALFDSASGLDSTNREALFTLINGAYGDFAGSARDAVTASSKAAAKQVALTEATQRSNGKGAHVRQIKTA